MLRRSLALKILLALGVTVAAVIGIYTYFVIRVQSHWWYERTQAQNVLTTSLVKDHLTRVMVSGRGEEVQRFLQQLIQQQDILQGRIIAPDGTIVFSTVTQEIKQATFKTPPDLFSSDQVLHGLRNDKDRSVAVAMAPIKNQETCIQCHDPNQTMLGAVVLEKSMEPAEASIASNRNLVIVYGIVIFVLISVVLWLLIVRLVTQPVGRVLHQMRRIQQGDFGAHAEAHGTDEIGELSRGFNAMVQSLDATQRELTESHEKQIQQAGKLASIGELASGIAHEIRNPLAGIGAAVEVLAENNNGNGQYAEVAGEIHTQIARLSRTIRDLLDFAKPREPEVAPCDVHEVIKPMLALARPDAQKQRVRIVEEFALDLPPISADAQLLQQAILNVVLNGVQAMPNGGTLTVKTELTSHSLDDRTVLIIIRDTGVGITTENLQKIFSPFFTTKHRGTGLGLSITRTIIEKHHGLVTVESEPGRGTAFTMQFAPTDGRFLQSDLHNLQSEKKEVLSHA